MKIYLSRPFFLTLFIDRKSVPKIDATANPEIAISGSKDCSAIVVPFQRERALLFNMPRF